MKMFLIFLLGWFIVGGTSIGDRLARRPVVVGVGCAVFAASFYSLRVIV